MANEPKVMTVAELRRTLERMRDDDVVVIPVTLPHSTMGGRPTVAVVSVGQGFDWDRGKLFLSPAAKLHPVGDDFVTAKALVHEYAERIGFALNALNSNLEAADRVKTAKGILSKRIS